MEILILEIQKEITWGDFINNCGKNSFTSNGVRAKNLYEKLYLNKRVDWQGAIL